MAKGNGKKIAKHKASQTPDEKPAKQPHSRQIPAGGISWRFSRADKGGPFAWSSLTDASDYKAVMERLHCFETMSLEEIAKSGSHDIELGRLSKDAQQRLQEIQQDDIDSLMSFRVTGPKRVFCIREREVMRVLWFDPDHQVCPAPKKHT
ncbi:hypothetical protein EGM97_10160 [Pseudomonas sp. AF32]|uniref:hypothetical protein n=1 Tax=Pseudomonas sp. AF32 TaxID=554390 RepID=UPI001EEF568F|nr:hypothetical protein [Pseudomonas sp. AF32]MCG6575067.1 hypothetical protein [Pseudomonas sp. AF32]